MAHPRRARHRPREPFLRLGARGRHIDSSRFSRESWRARSRARHHRRRFRRIIQLRETRRWLDRRPPLAAQADRHHRLSRHRPLDLRLRLRANLAHSFGVARAGMGWPRQPRAVARHAAGRLRRAGSSRPRLRLRARDGHPRRRPRTALRHGASRHTGRSRRSELDAASRPRRGGCFCLSRASRQTRAGPSRAKHRVKLQAAAEILLAFSRGCFCARHRRFCSHAFNSPRQPDSRPAFRNRASCDRSLSPSTRFYNFINALGLLSCRRARRPHRQAGSAGSWIFCRRRRMRGFYLRAAHDSRPRGSLWACRNSRSVSAVARKIARSGYFAGGNSRIGLRSACHGEWCRRSDFEYCGGSALVERKPGGGICLCGNFHARWSSC